MSAREIQLTRGLVALVDDADFLHLSQQRWHALATGKDGRFIYAGRTVRREDGTRGLCLLHRYLMSAPAGQFVDHINRDTLDNRRSNLRLCTKAENCRNGGDRGAVSGFKGVCWYPRYGRWTAHICVDYRSKTLGYFDSAEQAARAYDHAARVHFGEFARLNFPAVSA